MSDFDLRTHRECGHPREQEIPEDVPKDYQQQAYDEAQRAFEEMRAARMRRFKELAARR